MDFYLNKELLLIKQDPNDLDDYGRLTPGQEIPFFGHFAYNTVTKYYDNQAKEHKTAIARVITKYTDISENDLVKYRNQTYTVGQVDRIDFMGDEVLRVWLK